MNKTLTASLALAAAFILLTSGGQAEFIDNRDGNKYRTVKIGEQNFADRVKNILRFPRSLQWANNGIIFALKNYNFLMRYFCAGSKQL